MSADEDLMAPEASPTDAPKKAGVRRVNNMPLYLGGLVLIAFLGIMVMVAGKRAEQQNVAAAAVPEAEKKTAGNTMKMAEGIVAGQESGVIPAKGAAAATAPAGNQLVQPGNGAVQVASSPTSTALNPADRASGSNLEDPPRLNEADHKLSEAEERLRQMKITQFEQAVGSKTSVQFAQPKSRTQSREGSSGTATSRDEGLARLAALESQINAQGNTDPMAAYQARLKQARAIAAGSSGGSGGGGEGMGLLAQDGESKAGIEQFDKQGEGDRWRLHSKVEAPPTPYTLRTGFVIPGKLISGINSDLPGEIVAQIGQDVYDTPTGKYLLLPQGSRLNGKYSSEIIYGQSRVLVAWTRIIFPDGKALDIGAMPGADGAGYAGFSDQVNNHLWRLYSSAFLLSGITAGVALSQPEDNSFNSKPDASSAMSEALGQQLGQVSAQLIQKNMNIAPTLQIRSGYRFNIIVTKDMAFTKPYQQFDY